MPDDKSKGSFGKPSEQQLKQNAAASYLNLLTSWGIQITPEVKSFVNKAVLHNASSAQFTSAVRATKFYAQRFKGIMRKDGTMRMTEAQYISGYNSARDYAGSLGRPFSPKLYALALANGNSPAEIRSKLQAADTMKQYAPVMNEFKDYLLATGVVKKPPTKAEMMAYIMKAGPKEWEQAWMTAQQSAELARYGIDVGKPVDGSDISYKELKALQKQSTPGEGPDYSALAQAAEALPASRLYGLGITKKDLVKLAFNTKDAPKVADRVKLAIGTARETAQEQRVNPQLSQSGLSGGAPPVQATE